MYPVPVRGAVLAATVVHCVLCVAPDSNASISLDDRAFSEEIFETGRALSRAAMVFPLLIAISGRLAVLVPTFFLGVIGIFIFVALAKKAFIISLFALLISYLDKYKHSRPKIIHVHSSGHHYPEIGPMEFDSSFHHHHHSPHKHHKFFDFPGKKHLRKWPKIDHDPWSLTSTSMEGELDTYLPQATRRTAQLYRPPLMFAPQGMYYPRYMLMNATEAPPLETSSIGITPELQKFIEKTLVEEEEDPR